MSHQVRPPLGVRGDLAMPLRRPLSAARTGRRGRWRCTSGRDAGSGSDPPVNRVSTPVGGVRTAR